MKINQKIAFLRTLKGWSQEEMSSKLNMSPNGYAKIERGETNVQLSRLEKIAAIFGMEIKDLFNFNEKVILNSNFHDNIHQNNYIDSANELINKMNKLQVIIEQKDKEIEFLKQQNHELREINKDLKEIIYILKNNQVL